MNKLFNLKSSEYDILKKICLYYLPALATLILTVFTIWELPYGEMIAGTITAFDAFLGRCLQISSDNYWEEKADEE